MKIKELSAPKSAPKDANDIEADVIKRQKQQLANRSAQLGVQKAQKS